MLGSSILGTSPLGSEETGTPKTSAPPPAPPITSGLVGHLEASNLNVYPGNRVTSAPGVGGGADWTAQRGGPILRAGGYNNKRYLEQTSAGEGLQLSVDFRAADHTIIVAAKYRGTNNQRILSSVNNNYLLGWWGGRTTVHHCDNWVYLDGAETKQNPAQTELLFFTGRRAGTAHSFAKNGVFLPNTHGGPWAGPWVLTTNGYQANTEFSDANVYEVLVYNRALSDAEVRQLNDYLEDKYKPGLRYRRKFQDLVPYGYWALGEGNTAAGAIAPRTHGLGTLTYRGTITTAVNYHNADAPSAVFTAGDDQITTDTTIPDFVLNSTHSVSWWFNLNADALTGECMVLGGGQAELNKGLHLGVREGKLYQGFYGNDLQGPAVSTGRWYHVVMLWDGGGNKRIYLDGVEVATQASAEFIGGSANLAIGTTYPGGANNPRYRLSHFGLWDRALTPTEIKSLYESSKPLSTTHYSKAVLDDAPLAYYPLDEVSGLPQDRSGNGKHAIAVNGTVNPGNPQVLGEGGTSHYVGGGNIALPGDLYANPPAISFEIWAKKNGDLSANSLFEAKNAAGFRIANVHLGWGDGNIYWDCGGDGSTNSWQRIQKVRDFDLQQNHHYVFTRNVSTGVQNIYVDGVLWHTGTNSTTIPIGTTTAVNIASYTDGTTTFVGLVDEFAVYPRELTAAEVREHYALGGGTNEGDYSVVTYGITGGVGGFYVPAGADTVHVDIAGGQGGAGGGAPGQGAVVQARLAATPGEILEVRVGGRGADGGQNQTEARKPGGYNGGGTGGWSNDLDNANERHGGAGGGASDLRRNGTKLVVAGGGGGSGFSNTAGGHGGQVGQRGGVAPNTGVGGGYGGTASAGGNNGANEVTASTTTQSGNGASGGAERGGDGSYVTWQSTANNYGGGGGGGGGYFGGGGGQVAGGFAEAGGGGGGSSFVAAGATNISYITGGRAGVGYVKVGYPKPARLTSFSAGVSLRAPATVSTSTLLEATGQASLLAAAHLAVSASRTTEAGANLLAAAQMAASAVRETTVASALNAAGHLAADAILVTLLNAQGVLTAETIRTTFASASLLAPANLTAYAQKTMTTGVLLTAAAQLAVNATLVVTVAAQLNAPGRLTATGTLTVMSAAQLRAPLVLTATGQLVIHSTVSLRGPPLLTATATVLLPGFFRYGSPKPVLPGRDYVWSIYARRNVGNVLAFTEVRFYNGAMGLLQTVGGPKTPVTDAPQRLVTRAQAPVGAVYAGLFGGMTGMAEGDRITWDASQWELGEVETAYAPRSDEILPSAVQSTMLALGAVTTDRVAAGAITNSLVAIGAIDARTLGGGAVTDAKMADGAVTTRTIVAGAVVAGAIAAGAVVTDKLAANAVTAGTIAAGAIGAGHIAAGAVVAGKIAADAVAANEIAAGAISTTELAAGSVVADRIAANAVVAGKIAANAVTAGTVAAGVITSTQIATDTIVAGNIAAGAIAAGEIAANAVIAEKIAAGQVVTAALAAGSVVTDRLASLAVVTDKLAAGAVTTAKVTANAITASEIAAGAVTADEIAATAVTGKVITGGTFRTGVSGQDRIEMIDTVLDMIRWYRGSDNAAICEIREFMGTINRWGMYLNAAEIQIGHTGASIYQVGRRVAVGTVPAASTVRVGTWSGTHTSTGLLAIRFTPELPNVPSHISCTVHGEANVMQAVRNINQFGFDIQLKNHDGTAYTGSSTGTYYAELFNSQPA